MNIIVAQDNLFLDFNSVNYKLALTRALTTTEQQRHLPSASMEIKPHAAIALTFNNPWGSSGWGEAPCAPGKLVGQVFREWDVFRSQFYDLNPCNSSYLEKH